jgi:hypothetical protein
MSTDACRLSTQIKKELDNDGNSKIAGRCGRHYRPHAK